MQNCGLKPQSYHFILHLHEIMSLCVQEQAVRELEKSELHTTYQMTMGAPSASSAALEVGGSEQLFHQQVPNSTAYLVMALTPPLTSSSISLAYVVLSIPLLVFPPSSLSLAPRFIPSCPAWCWYSLLLVSICLLSITLLGILTGQVISPAPGA